MCVCMDTVYVHVCMLQVYTIYGVFHSHEASIIHNLCQQALYKYAWMLCLHKKFYGA